MIEDLVIDSILEITDESGGDSALDGFEFQVSSAIYLVFNELLSKNDCALIYEKVEDFIIITEAINLYQAKSISKNLTPNVLFSPSRKTKSDDSGLSIIEKIHINYTKVKERSLDYPVFSNLIICENQVFSKKLCMELEGITELKNINFNEFSNKAKAEIVEATQFDEYYWEKLSALRIIPKSRHEEVTRVFIEDVVSQLYGENKINSAALYTALTFEIKKIRKTKSKLTSDTLKRKMTQFSEMEDELNFNDYVYLLRDKDKRNIRIANSFNQIQNNLLIDSHPNKSDYAQLKYLIEERDCENVDDIKDIIESEVDFTLMKVRLKNHELIALIMIVLAKEVIK